MELEVKEFKVRKDLIVRVFKVNGMYTFKLIQKYEDKEIGQEITRTVAYMLLEFPDKMDFIIKILGILITVLFIPALVFMFYILFMVA